MSPLDRLAEPFDDGLDFPFDDSVERESGMAFEFRPEETQPLSINELEALGIRLIPPARVSIKSLQSEGLIPQDFELDTAKLKELSIIRLAEFQFTLAITDQDNKIRDIDFSDIEPLSTQTIPDLLLEPLA